MYYIIYYFVKIIYRDDIEIPVYFILGHYIYDMFENININSYDENYFHAFKNRIVGYHNKDEL